jgi:hypothetical protein
VKEESMIRIARIRKHFIIIPVKIVDKNQYIYFPGMSTENHEYEFNQNYNNSVMLFPIFSKHVSL